MSQDGDVCCVPGCGHPRSEHYTYLRNNTPVQCCRMCDPMRARIGDVSLSPSESDREADAHHEFQPV